MLRYPTLGLLGLGWMCCDHLKQSTGPVELYSESSGMFKKKKVLMFVLARFMLDLLSLSYYTQHEQDKTRK